MFVIIEYFLYFFFRFVYPEFLPNPDWRFRDRISEKLERRDMMRRRAVMNIPEFYVGKGSFKYLCCR